MVGTRNIMMSRDSPDPSVAEGEHMHNLQQLLKERGKDRIRQQEREGEHKYACARCACASEIEMNGKSAKELFIAFSAVSNQFSNLFWGRLQWTCAMNLFKFLAFKDEISGL